MPCRPAVRPAAAGFLFLLICTGTARAQSLSDLATAPLLPNRGALALSAQTPTAFLPYLPDEETRAFVNPARAARFEGGLAYGTLGPSSRYTQGYPVEAPFAYTPLTASPGNHVTASVLTRGRAVRWLIVLDQRLNGDEFSDRSDRESSLNVQPNVTDQTREALEAATNVRVAAIGRTRQGGWSVGLFGGYRTSQHDETRAERTSTSYQNYGVSFASEEERTAASLTSRASFAAGVEFGRYEAGWEVFGSIGYQGGQAETSARAFASSTSRNEDDQTPPYIRITESESRAESQATDDATALSAEVYAAVRLQPAHTLFARYIGVYGGGASSSSATLLSHLFTTEGFGDDLTTLQDETIANDTDIPDGDLTGGTTALSLGYAYEADWREVHAFAGAELFGYRVAYDLANVLALAGIDRRTHLSRRDQTRLGGGLRFPLYVTYPRRTPLRAFVGGVLEYEYERTETDDTVVQTRLYPAPQTLEDRWERLRERFVSETAFVFGAQLRLKHGLRAQAAFNGSLAAPAAWTVSLGYRF